MSALSDLVDFLFVLFLHFFFSNGQLSHAQAGHGFGCSNLLQRLFSQVASICQGICRLGNITLLHLKLM